jgi:predicted amidophosphoribosyltransferase
MFDEGMDKLYPGQICDCCGRAFTADGYSNCSCWARGRDIKNNCFKCKKHCPHPEGVRSIKGTGVRQKWQRMVEDD